MRTVSENYLNYINSSLVRRPKSKFVVDGIHYKGDEYLVSYPKVEHKTDTAIGSFPAKTCELEILNRNGTFDLHGKEVTVYRGLDIGGITEWVRIGVFTASDDNIKTNINKQTITFKGTDKTQLLDKPYGGAAQWDVSKRVLHIVKDICDRNGVALATSLFPLNDYVFPDVPPGLDFDNITERQMIAYIAELSGSIAMFAHNGKLIFVRETDTGVTIPKTKYKTLSVENPIGPINAISFGHATYEDALLHTQEGVTDSTKVEWAINDNPLTTTKDRNNLIQRISGYFFGRSFTPFELDGIIDDYIFDLNDTVTIEKKNGDTVKVTLLEMANTSRIKSRFGASLQTPGKTKTAIAGSVKDRLGKVEFIVDHQQNSISTLIEDAEGMQTSINANAKGLKAQALATQNLVEQYNQLSNDFSNLDIAGTVTTEVQKEATLELIAGKVEAKVSANYASKSDLGDYVKNEDLTTAITATESKITEEAKRISKIEQAGYITETEAQGLIDLSSESIALSVKKDIKIGTRNILLDSACFGGFTPTSYAGQSLTTSMHSSDIYPSGKFKRIMIEPASNATQYGYVGARFKNADILGETGITKIKTDTLYTLSFWLYDYFVPENEQRKLSKNILISAGAEATVEYLTQTDLYITNEPQRIAVTFRITGEISQFHLVIVREYKSSDMLVDMRLSSIKLEEGNVATDWTPNQTELANAVQAAEAKLELCVQTDENGNLKSAIHAKANQITIESDNFTLDGEGNMTCNNANITGGRIYIHNNDDFYPSYVLIEDGKLSICIEDMNLLDINSGLIIMKDTDGSEIYSYCASFMVPGGLQIAKDDATTLVNFQHDGLVDIFGDLNVRNNTFINGNLSVKGNVVSKVTFETGVYFNGMKGATPAGTVNVNGKSVQYTWLAANVSTGELLWVTP